MCSLYVWRPGQLHQFCGSIFGLETQKPRTLSRQELSSSTQLASSCLHSSTALACLIQCCPPSQMGRIFEVGAVGPLSALENFAHELDHCLWIHSVGDAAALSGLVRGGSSVNFCDYIIGQTWNLVVKDGCFPWFDRVDSAVPPTALSRTNLFAKMAGHQRLGV